MELSGEDLEKSAPREYGLGNQERPEMCLLSKQVAVIPRAPQRPLGKQGESSTCSTGGISNVACVATLLVAPGDVFALGLESDQLLMDSLYLAGSPTLLFLGL